MERAKQWRRGGRDADTYADGECNSICKFSHRGLRGYETPSVGGDRFVTAQHAGTVGGAAFSRARTVENLTFVADKIHTQVRWRAGLFSPVTTSNDARALAHEGLQQQSSTETQQGGVSTPVAATMRPAANSPPVGRERRTTAPAWTNRERGRQTRAPGGLQQQEWTGDQLEGVQLRPTATMHSAVVLTPVGRGPRTATPAWMSMRMGDTAHAPGELQQQPSIGAQQGRSRAPAIAETRTAAVSPQAERGKRTTTSARRSTGKRGPALSSGGLQH